MLTKIQSSLTLKPLSKDNLETVFEIAWDAVTDYSKKPEILAVGMAEKAKEFIGKGSEIYQRYLPDGVKEHH